ncbi:uncharacterized protein LOC131635093 [Vicia villosa]|uniref:uncharacterized protein LOC131635093 n=1 Tax=Vicia villosa TaxID=3911 RepID=UPI00273BEBC3|nr:uncharacterized protein LOC131635093 [Vicia villosa]
MRTRGRDGTVAGRAIAVADEAGTSVLRVGRVPPNGSNRKQRTEQAGRGFRAPHCRGGRTSTAVDEQVHQDEVAEVEAVVVVREPAVVEEQVPVADEEVPRVEERVAVVKEGVAEERVVHDTDTTTGTSTESSVHIDGGFPGGYSNRLVLTGYADHVAYRIWQGKERPVLKLTSHRSKLKNFPERPMPEQELVNAERYQAAARAYMLCTLFANKSGVYIDALYLTLFSNLENPCWAWGVAALTMLYTALNATSHPDTRQLAGYLSLLQVEGQIDPSRRQNLDGVHAEAGCFDAG